MENAETILVVILASFLAIFLLIAIVAGIKLIQVLNHLRKIIEKAEAIADKAENAAAFFAKASGPAMFGKLIANIVDTISNKAKKKR